MATHPGHPLGPIAEALNTWQVWDQNWRARDARPNLGEVLGIGSANTVFSLDRVPDLVLRVRHNTASLSLNSPKQEITLWQAAAALGFAPDVLWAGTNEDVVITKRLTFDGIDEEAQSHLLKRVHESSIDGPRLSLEETATRYALTIEKKDLAHLAVNIDIPAIREDLQRLDSEPTCFCHNDFTPTNIGRLEGRYLAIDWEYASLGSRHFDIAVASQHMDFHDRDTFAERTAGAFFDRCQWQVACRVVPLMDHLWSLAALGHTEGVHSKQKLEESWGVE